MVSVGNDEVFQRVQEDLCNLSEHLTGCSHVGGGLYQARARNLSDAEMEGIVHRLPTGKFHKELAFSGGEAVVRVDSRSYSARSRHIFFLLAIVTVSTVIGYLVAHLE